jgi:hypothetical protein
VVSNGFAIYQSLPELIALAVTVAVSREANGEAGLESYSEMEASAGFEPAVEVLQTSALPLG